MNVRELKEFLNNLSEECDNWDVLMDVDPDIDGLAKLGAIYLADPETKNPFISLISQIQGDDDDEC